MIARIKEGFTKDLEAEKENYAAMRSEREGLIMSEREKHGQTAEEIGQLQEEARKDLEEKELLHEQIKKLVENGAEIEAMQKNHN